MNPQNNFWKLKANEWENKRYDSLYSQFIFSSLIHRQKYFSYIINQLPPQSKIIELGCGSGRIYSLLKNKENISYFGFDISPSAIANAKNKFQQHDNAHWLTASIDEINQNHSELFKDADLVFSAGLLDWLNDEQIKIVHQLSQATNFVHSFSLLALNYKTKAHALFSYFITIFKKIDYSPRKFSLEQIKKLFYLQNQPVAVTQDPVFSFGAFIHNLQHPLSHSATNFKNYLYFSQKNQLNNFIEVMIKNNELRYAKKHFTQLEGKKILEIGSGLGHYTKFFLTHSPCQLTALDPSINTQQYFKHEAYHFIHHTFENSQLSEKFDVVFAIGVIEFIEHYQSFLDQLKRVTHSKSKIFIVKPNNSRLMSLIYQYFHKLKGRQINNQSDEFIQLTSQTGFKVLRIENFGPLNQLIELSISE